VNNVDVSTVTLLWFFLWRMTLVGLALGAGLGAAYGLVVVPSVFFLTGVLGSEGFATNVQVAGGAYFLMIFSTPFGAVLGALAGLTLGIVEGVLLCVITLFRYRDPSSETSKYQRGAGLTCAVGTLVSFAVLWGAYLFPLVLPNSGLTSAEVREVLSRDLEELLLFVVGPAPVAIGAAWWSSRLIARQYVRRVSRGL
jgi:hypothetical protein